MRKSWHLILMSRAPVRGETKTRLIPRLGADGARDFHVACINDLLHEGRQWAASCAGRGLAPVRLHLFITPPASQPAFRRAGVEWPDDFHLHNQRGENLGERMADAIARVLSRDGDAAGVLLVGTDLPLLSASALDEAAAALEEYDVVFGPTRDGGYYLVGVKEHPGRLFELPRWGGASVLEESLAAARGMGKSAALIGALPDADSEADLRAILAHPLAKSLAGRKALRFLAARLGEGGASGLPAEEGPG